MRFSFLLLLLVLTAGCRQDGAVPLGDPAVWTAHPADGVTLDLADDRGALRLDFAFTGGGYAIARREVDLDLPQNYAFRFKIRGEAPVNTLEFKLIDDSGENVWWHVRRDVAWPRNWEVFTIKKRQISFAWGPGAGGELTHVAAIELAVTAGSGGQGSVWIEGLEMVTLPVPPAELPAPLASASSRSPDQGPDLAVDGAPGTAWAPAGDDPQPTLTVDLGLLREFGGLTVDFLPDRAAADYTIEAAGDDDAWRTLQAVAGAHGDHHNFYLPESEARRLRLRLKQAAAGPAPAVAEVQVRPLAWSENRNAFFMNIAAEAPRGQFPRGLLGEPTAWTVVGVDRDPREGLLGADGALEVGPGEFSIEPFLRLGGRLVTWNDVTSETRLVDEYLPLPQVVWTSGDWRLTVTAAGTGPAGGSSLLATYRLENRGSLPGEATLYLALRPFQVNPPVQFLNVRGGAAPVGAIARADDTLLVDGRPRVRLSPAPDAFGAATFLGGDIVRDYLARGELPAAAAVQDGFGAASAAAAYRLNLAAGQAAEVALLAPLHDGAPLAMPAPAEAMRAAQASWHAALDRVSLSGPDHTRDAFATLKAQLGYILVNRADVRIQPGSRSYARSWIRDGALTGVALLRWGQTEPARDFLRWYAPHQYAGGKIPCVVDWRGADPVPEHDSTGEFIYLVAETYRFTGDRDLLAEMWPRVKAGVAYLESLLDQRRTAEYTAPGLREFYGILPPSISHEGYSAKPMHSYWDDFFALRGLKDAAWLAGELQAPEQENLTRLADRFAADLGASVAAAMARHGIDHVPGCADLGDFDATSTTIALDPAAAAAVLPPGALDATFERYWDFFRERRDGAPWEAFTPYEIRNVGAFVRLGWRQRAQELLDFFLEHRTTAGWRQWAEVVGSDPVHARFIGDMPHTWVGSDYARGLLDMLVYERRAEGATPAALVLAAGVQESWLNEGGIRLAGLPTAYGSLDYTLRRTGPAQVVMNIGGSCRPPAGGLLLDPPTGDARATVDGRPAVTDDQGRVIITGLPAEVCWTE